MTNSTSWLGFSNKVMRTLFTIAMVAFWTACADDSQNIGPDGDAASAKGKSGSNTTYSPTFASADGVNWTITIPQEGKKAVSHILLQFLACDGSFLAASNIVSATQVLPGGVFAPEGYTGLNVTGATGSGTGCTITSDPNSYFVKIENFVEHKGNMVINITLSTKATTAYLVVKAGTSCSTVFDSAATVTISCGECDDETAWSAGSPYCTGNGGSWATFTEYSADGEATLFAGQTKNIGKVTFSAVDLDNNVTITVAFIDGWGFQDVEENLKVQGYASAPSSDVAKECNPSIGGFANKATNELTIKVPAANYYGVHLDVTGGCE